MNRERAGYALIAVAALLALGVVAAPTLISIAATGEGYQPPDDPDYDYATVTVVGGDGTELGQVRAAIADNFSKKYTGLSETDSLPEDRGMLFPYEEEGHHTYVMRGMDFGIDIVYIGANGTITSIHHAEKPPEGTDGESFRYPGTGKYVLEVNYEWTTRHSVEVGDEVEIEGL
jgi:uncharacterized membrane protein (UPF0127 family)